MSGDTLETIALTFSDSGRKVTVHVGDRITLDLPENPTTGFRWGVPDLPGLDIVENMHVAGGNGIGGSGTRHISMRAVGTGLLVLHLERRQAWEPDTPPESTFLLELEIH